MTTPTAIKNGSATWWVLQALRDFGAMTEHELFALGTHEAPAALGQVRTLHMVVKNHDGQFEIQPKGRKALALANKQRWKDNVITKATSRTLVNAGSKTLYDAAELLPYDGRPGSMDAFALPSRAGASRTWRDGRVEAA